MQACSDCLDECRFVRRLRGPLFHEEILFLQALDTIDPWTAPQKASVPVCGMYLDELQLLDHPGAKEMRASSLPTQAELGWGTRGDPNTEEMRAFLFPTQAELGWGTRNSAGPLRSRNLR